MTTPVSEFPGAREHIEQPYGLQACGLALRPAHAGDLSWLRDLYASTRSEELATVPWPESVKLSFLNQQFDLQHAHYMRHFGNAAFTIVECAQAPIGRLYLDQSTSPHVLVDISLLPSWRSKGIGTALIAHAQDLAAASGQPLSLHVLHANPLAQRLYARLGFVATEVGTTHLAMCWSPPSAEPPRTVS